MAELERLKQRVRDLELEVARSVQNRQTNSSLMEDLNSERARVIAVDKKVCDYSRLKISSCIAVMKNTLIDHLGRL